MKLSVRTPEYEGNEAVKSLVEQRLLFALARFEERIEHVNVHLTDRDCPPGRFERRCHMVARLIPWGAVHVEKTADGAYAAIDHAADRLGRYVEHELARRGCLLKAERVGASRER